MSCAIKVDKTGKMPKRIRVVHCPLNVAGNPAMLAEKEREFGYESLCLTLEADKYNANHDKLIRSGEGFSSVPVPHSCPQAPVPGSSAIATWPDR